MRRSVLLFVCLLAVPASARGQAGGITPVTARYAGRREFLNGQTQVLGMSEVAVTDTVIGGAHAWVVVNSWKIERTASVDSVVMRAGDLSPISRRMATGDVRLTVEVRDGVLSGEIKWPGGTVPLSLRTGERSFLNYYALRTALRAWPIAAGWKGTAAVLELVRGEELAPLALEVTGEETIRVPAGEFDCWVLHVTGPNSIDERWWVSKAGHHFVRTREPVGMERNIIQLDLVSLVPPP